jgi:hypothetical protein
MWRILGDKNLGIRDNRKIADALFAVDVQHKSSPTLTLAHSQSAILDEIEGDNAGIVADEVYEINRKIVHEVYVATVARGIMELDNMQQQQLENIIYQCPLVGGRAVYDARSLYSLVNDSLVYFDDSLECALLGMAWRKAIVPPTPLPWVSLSPNPSTDKVTMAWEKGIEWGAIRVYSALGVLEKEILRPSHLSIEQGKWDIDVDDWGQGLHIFHLFDAQNQLLKTLFFIKI